jgi:hypothetical protein
MILKRILNLLLLVSILFTLAGCNMPNVPEIPGLRQFLTTPVAISPSGELVATSIPQPAETLVSFTVQAPPDSPPGEPVYLSILDEVTGLALNTQVIQMEAVEDSGSSTAPTYRASVPFVIGSLVKYRYERQSGPIRVAEHLSDGSAVRYRLLHVDAESSVEDVISRWTDTAYALPTGRIQGQAVDAATNQPIPNLLVSAGGAQTLTASDGSFMLEGLPPGVHNLVALALDGSYQVFQQGALVAVGATTPTPLKLNAATFVNIVFVVTVPKGTLPVVPLRMAGNLLQFGNTFADLAGGMSTLASRMPTLSLLPDGRYSITAALPAGADLRYKYTLGDGFWNAEHNADGSFRLRQLIVPDDTLLIEDKVDTWYDTAVENPASLTFAVDVPKDTPAADYVSIQFNPLIGWSEPIPMWRLGENRWAYALYSPLHLPGDFSYRYCRNGQCGYADDAQTPGVNDAGRQVQISDKPQTLNDQVNAWAGWSGGASAVLPGVENVTGRGNGYWTGIALIPAYHPSWNELLPEALKQIQATGANWLVFSPTWSYGRSAPGNQLPLLALNPGQDALWPDLAEQIQAGGAAGLNIALRPTPRFLISSDEWWTSAPRDASWWQVWFEQYRTFALHHADLAARMEAQALILGGGWLAPALPGGKLADGSPSGVPQDAEARWKNLLAEVRQHYQGQLIWAMPAQAIKAPPSFLSSVDRVVLDLNVTARQKLDAALGDTVDHWMDVPLRAFQALAGKPLILSVACPSDPDLQAQVDCYQAALSAANSRDWIGGFISTGFYPAATLHDTSTSIYGKPASELLGLWFPQMVK